MFHCFFQFPSNTHVLIPLFALFQFYSVVSQDNKVHNLASFFLLLLIITRSSNWDEGVHLYLKIPEDLCVSLSRTDSGLYIYYLFVWSNFNFMHMLYGHIINMHIYTYTCRIHIDAITKTSDTVLRKIYLSLYLKGLCVRGSGRPSRTATYWPPQPLQT